MTIGDIYTKRSSIKNKIFKGKSQYIIAIIFLKDRKERTKIASEIIEREIRENTTQFLFKKSLLNIGYDYIKKYIILSPVFVTDF